jgi:ubiquinone/menaquinone biosynthesis C-methylase UbiE
MNHRDHVNLLRGAIPVPGGVWGEFGSGSGAFTLALAELIGPQGRIISVDQNAGALKEQAQRMQAQFPNVPVEFRRADFTRPLDLPPLDGILMANSLHFIRHRQKPELLSRLKGHLRPGGRLVLVEYNIDAGNLWVPYPFSYPTWETLASQCGFLTTRLVATRPSSFLREFYCAESRI